MTTPSTNGPWSVVEVDAAATHELRRFVLRRGTPTDNVNLEADEIAGTRHLAIRDSEDRVIATSTWSDQESPVHPGRRAVQLRAMAVHDDYQRRGLGGILLAAGIARARELGADLVWANGRDSALEFYTRHGFEVVGAAFVTHDTQLPHHVVVLTL